MHVVMSRRLVLALLASTLAVGPACAQSKAFMEAATFSGAGNTMVLSRVPVADGAGRITYKDVTIPFSVSSTGILTAGMAKIVASPNLLVGDFVAGKYVNGADVFNLSGPGVGPDGRTTWSIESPDCSSFTAGWTTGPVAGHPSEPRLKNVGITYGGIAYGVGGGNGFCFGSTYWGYGSLVGAAGGPTGITLYSYTKSGGDAGAPYHAISFKRCTTNPC